MKRSRESLREALVRTADEVALLGVKRSINGKTALLSVLVAGLTEFSLYETSWNTGLLFSHANVPKALVDKALDSMFDTDPPAEWQRSLVEPILITANRRLNLLRQDGEPSLSENRFCLSYAYIPSVARHAHGL